MNIEDENSAKREEEEKFSALQFFREQEE